MGSQRRLIEDLIQHYVLSEELALELARKFEAIQIGDNLDDALYEIRNGDWTKGIWELNDLLTKLEDAVKDLEDEVRPLQRRNNGRAMEE